MSPKGILVRVGVVLTLLFGVMLYAIRERNEANSAKAILAFKSESLEREASRLEKSIAAANLAHAHLAAALKAKVPAPSTSRRQAPGLPLDIPNLIQNNPKLLALFRAAQRVRLGQPYGPLFQTLHLSSDQIAKFEDILADHEDQVSDVEAAAKSQGLMPSDPAVATLRQQADQQMQASAASLLGEAGFQQEQAYNRVLPVRTLVDQIAGTLAFSAPLTAQQADQLTQVLANSSPSYQSGGVADWDEVNYEQVDREAQAFLSGPQLTAWQQMEPMGGGPSRWRAPLDNLVKQALSGPSDSGKGP